MQTLRHSPLAESLFLSFFALFGSTLTQGQDTASLFSQGMSTVSGEWGELQYYEIAIRPPADGIWQPQFDEISRWSFPLENKSEVEQLFVQLGFSPPLLELLREDAIWDVSGEFIELHLTDRIIESMEPEERARLVSWWNQHHNSFKERIVINFDDQNFGAVSGALEPDILERLQSLCFLRGNVLSFMDRAYLLRKFETREEKEQLVRTLFISHGLMARLKLDPSSDLAPIIQYWEAEGRNPGVRSVIEGMRSTEGVDYLDIVHLLPPLPRKYLNTFVTADDTSPEGSPDCFWTAIQFFNNRISHRSLDHLPVDHFILDDFELVVGPPQFGDLVCLFRKDQRTFVHSYIHIAENIVFTKNGRSYLRPWILSTYDRMASIYDTEGEFHVQAYRARSRS